MDLFVWVGQTVLAVVFAVLGPLKLQYQSFITRRGSAWAQGRPQAPGPGDRAARDAGAIALVWPLATHTIAWLTPIAGLCLALLMGAASWFHTPGARPSRRA